MNKKLRIGLIGLGNLGTVHAKTIASSNIAELYAVCDTNVNSLDYAKTHFGVKTYTDINNFLLNPLDGVVIASSTPQHLAHISAVAKKGMPIFTEKPVGLTLEDTDKILKIIVDGDIPFQIGFQRRWDSRYQRVKNIIDSGEIGRPVLYKAYGRDPNASNPKNWGLDKNGGLFLNSAIHDYDAARFLTGKEVNSVSASGAALIHRGLNNVGDIDTCATTLFMQDGSMAMTEWSRYATYGYDICMEMVCSEGIVKIGRTNSSEVTVYHKNDKAPSVFEVFSDAFKLEIEGFLNAIINGIPMSPGVEDARIALHLALCAHQSFNSDGKLIKTNHLKPLKKS